MRFTTLYVVFCIFGLSAALDPAASEQFGNDIIQGMKNMISTEITNIETKRNIPHIASIALIEAGDDPNAVLESQGDLVVTFDKDSTEEKGVKCKNGCSWESGIAPRLGTFKLDGNQGYIDLGTKNFGDKPFSFAIWAKTTSDVSLQNWARYLDCGRGMNNENVYFARRGTSNDIEVGIIRGDTGHRAITAGNVIQFNTWQYFAFTIDNRVGTLYINGAQVAQDTNFQYPRLSVRDKCYIGKSNWVWDKNFGGYYDKVEIWFDKALSSADISKRYEADISKPCSKSNGGCDELTKCIDNGDNPWNENTCGPCPPGYVNTATKKTKCADIDECSRNNGGCDKLTTCTNTPGSRECGTCPTGYKPETGEVPCVDLDECLEANGGCDPMSKCTNTRGSRTCGDCPTGFGGDPVEGCFDVNECLQSNGGCHPKVTCTNTKGSRTCGKCPTGYIGDGLKCNDYDECKINNGRCDVLTQCINTPGSRYCGDCPAGYKGNGEKGCVDIDECLTNNGGCDPNTECINTVGSRGCGRCPKGFIGDGATACSDIDECRVNNGGCHPRSQCINTPGSRDCGACEPGFQGNGHIGCTDLDECLSNNGGCHPLTSCYNTEGSRFCGPCPRGYRGNGDNGCLELDVCRLLPNGGCDPLVTCTNSPRSFGGRICGKCPDGMLGDGSSGCRPDKRFVSQIKLQKMNDRMNRGGDLYKNSFDVKYMTNKVAKLAAGVVNSQLGLTTGKPAKGPVEIGSDAKPGASTAPASTVGINNAAGAPAAAAGGVAAVGILTPASATPTDLGALGSKLDALANQVAANQKALQDSDEQLKKDLEAAHKIRTEGDESAQKIMAEAKQKAAGIMASNKANSNQPQTATTASSPANDASAASSASSASSSAPASAPAGAPNSAPASSPAAPSASSAAPAAAPAGAPNSSPAASPAPAPTATSAPAPAASGPPRA